VKPLISLIVPVWGDDELLVNLVTAWPLPAELAEWVVVAVRPGRSLRELSRCGIIRLVSCDRPSRGRQMNAGAGAARGTLLCFHHSDTELLPEHLSALREAASNDKVVGGAFHRRFRAQRIMWRDQLVRWLSQRGGPLFGDQSIFVKASVFQALGGFADIPLMEDLEFSRRLRRYGPVMLLDPPLWSPPRRLGRLGTWGRTLRNSAFIAFFYLGVDPRRLHSWYYPQFRKRPDNVAKKQELKDDPYVEPQSREWPDLFSDVSQTQTDPAAEQDRDLSA
jgi:hypothetical protein